MLEKCQVEREDKERSALCFPCLSQFFANSQSSVNDVGLAWLERDFAGEDMSSGPHMVERTQIREEWREGTLEGEHPAKV